MSFDLNDKTQSGFLLITDQSTYNKGTFDFRAANIYGQTEMKNFTGYVLDAWAPFDAFASNRFTLANIWQNSEDSVGAEATAFYRPISGFFVGLGAGNTFDKNENTHSTDVNFQLYGTIPGSEEWVLQPEAWTKLVFNVQSKTWNPTGYIGVSSNF